MFLGLQGIGFRRSHHLCSGARSILRVVSFYLKLGVQNKGIGFPSSVVCIRVLSSGIYYYSATQRLMDIPKRRAKRNIRRVDYNEGPVSKEAQGDVIFIDPLQLEEPDDVGRTHSKIGEGSKKSLVPDLSYKGKVVQGDDDFVEPMGGEKVHEPEKKKRRFQKATKAITGQQHRGAEHNAQECKFIIDPKQRFNGKVTFNYTPELPEMLNKYLSQEAIGMFRKTIFGHFLDCGVVHPQPQVFHGIMLREIECLDGDTIGFFIGGKVLKFGLEEFGVMSGLKMNGNMNLPIFNEADFRLKNEYFQEDVAVRKHNLLDAIKYKRWKNDDDAVKLAVMCVIHTYIMSSRQQTPISRDDFALVESGRYAEYPWGLASFKLLYSSLKGRLGKRNEEKGESKSFHYKVDGCPVIFQTWFYECCPRMAGHYASAKGTLKPRMCNWNTQGSAKIQLESLNSTIFDFPGLVVENIIPAGDEFEAMIYGDPQPVVKPKDNKRSSAGGSDLNNRFEALERMIADVSSDLALFKADIRSDLDVFKALVLNSLDSLIKNFEESRKETKGQRSENEEEGVSEANRDNINFESSIPDSLFVLAEQIGAESVRAACENIEREVDNDIVDEGLKVEEVCEKVVDEVDSRKKLSAEVSDLTKSLYQLVEYTPVKVGRPSDVPVDVEFDDEDVDVAVKVEKKGKKVKTKGKAKNLSDCVEYPLKHYFGSVGKCVSKVGRYNVMRGGFPLNSEAEMTDSDLMEMMDGLSTLFGEDHVDKDGKLISISQVDDMIPVPFDFVVATVNNRAWFRHLCYTDHLLQDSHINIFFYYLRKMLKYGKVKNKITTTDDMFDQRLRAVYDMFKDPKYEDNAGLFSQDSMISEYIVGKSLPAGMPWSSVDEVLMPVNINEHWIMVRLNLKGKYLKVYDSIRNVGHDEHVRKELGRYSELLPYFLFSLGMLAGKKPKGPIVKLPTLAPLKISWQNRLPVQTLQDCGAYTMAFSEYYAVKKMDLLKTDFDIEAFRQRVACLLYHYGTMKQQDSCRSEDEL